MSRAYDKQCPGLTKELIVEQRRIRIYLHFTEHSSSYVHFRGQARIVEIVLDTLKLQDNLSFCLAVSQTRSRNIIQIKFKKGF